MGSSINNWLGFSLSPQEQGLPTQAQDHHHSQTTSVSRMGFNSDEISGTGECFDLMTSDSTLPSLNLPPPFGILEAFNRNNQSPQDWDMKDMRMRSEVQNYKTATVDLSMLMGSSSCKSTSSSNSHNLENQCGPKLENFLGGSSFAHHPHKLTATASAYNNDCTPDDHYMYTNCSSLTPEVAANGGGGGGGGTINPTTAAAAATTTIGLSMIKNWLRNQQAPEHAENKNIGSSSDVVGRLNGTPAVMSAQTLSLSMSTESQTSSPLPVTASGGGGETNSSDKKQQQKGTSLDAETGAIEALPRKSIDTFGQRTSIYRGVTRHRWTGRYEAHLWDNSCRREGQTRKGRQVYLGGYDKEEKAARAYDLAALKYWGTTTTTNFPISNYEKELEEMKHMTRQEYVASLRRKSSGFSRGASIYRGVTRHHQHGRWQARIGRVAGNKDLYLGTFGTQEEAAEAYDIAAIKFRGLNAVTNFDMSRYDVKSILESSTLPIGGAAKRLKDAEQAAAAAQMTMDHHHHLLQIRRDGNDDEDPDINNNITSHLMTNIGMMNNFHGCWPSTSSISSTTIAAAQPLSIMQYYPQYHQYGHYQRPVWYCKQEQEQDHPSDSSTTGAVHSCTFQDQQQQLQLGSGTIHNFFQQPSSSSSSSSVLHNQHLMNLDSTGADANFAVMPVATTTVINPQEAAGNGFGDHNNREQINAIGGGYDQNNIYGTSTDDQYPNYHHARNLYYDQLPQQQSSSVTTPGIVAFQHHHQGSTCNNWVPTAVPTLQPIRANNVAVCHGGAQTFTVWNDT